MRNIPKTLLALGTAVVVLTAAASVERFQFSPEESTMTISGTSTIHDWTCDVESVSGWAEKTGEAFSSGLVTVSVADIECGKRVMNRKLRDALKAKENPVVTFTPESFEPTDGSWSTTGTLNVAGVDHEVPVTFTASGDQGQRISGEVEMSLEALGVERPKALMGTIKTGDIITVAFTVSAKSES